MAKLSQVDLARADRRAAAAQEAEAAIEQAGRGLQKCFASCKANTITAQTRYDLVICAGYVNDAIAALLKAEVDETPVGGLIRRA